MYVININIYMTNGKSSKKTTPTVSNVRKQVYRLEKNRGKYIWQVLRPQPMIRGSFYQVYKSCSKKNCCCQQGKKHGPFPALYVSMGGKRYLKMVRQADVPEVKRKALSYRACQQDLARIRKINKEIDNLLEEVKTLYLEEYR